MGIFYVYEHWRPDKKVCFWVGKGKGRRAYNFKRNSHYNNIVAKLSRLGMCVEVRLAARGLSEKKAHTIECKRIAFWQKQHNELANKTNGGEGVSGLKMPSHVVERLRLNKLGTRASKETREKMSRARLGKPMSMAARKKLSITKTGVKQGPLSLEHRAKIGAAHRGKKDPPAVRRRKKLAAQKRPPPIKSVCKKIAKTVELLWTDPKYRSRLLAAHAKRPPISRSTRRKMKAAQRARRAAHKVSATTKAKVSASIKEWHRQAGHKIS